MQNARVFQGAVMILAVLTAWFMATMLHGQNAAPEAAGLAPATRPADSAAARPVSTETPASAQPAPSGPTATRPADGSNARENAKPAPARAKPRDARQLGGEPESIVQVANLIYAGTKSSKCFSDHFLVKAEKESAISTSRRFHAVKLASDELFEFPLVIMTGEGPFQLTEQERENLRAFVDRGGFLLASAGCSSSEWDHSIRGELARIFPENPLAVIGMDHPVFHTVYDINRLSTKSGTPRPLEGITVHGHLGVLYSVEGLNDTAHTQGCCCCGGNEITNAVNVNVNILAYALVY